MTGPGIPLSAMTAAQMISAGELAKNQPASAAWHASYFAEEGDLDLYVQDLNRPGRMWKIAPDGAITEVST